MKIGKKIGFGFMALILALIHVCLADFYFFFGTVINPSLYHQMTNLVGFLLLFPFGLLALFKNGYGVLTLVILFWSGVYYFLLIKKSYLPIFMLLSFLLITLVPGGIALHWSIPMLFGLGLIYLRMVKEGYFCFTLLKKTFR